MKFGYTKSIGHCIETFDNFFETDKKTYKDTLLGKCIKITKKKNEYYTKKYDPNPIIENFKKTLGEDSEKYKFFNNFCNKDIKENCCNCISVSLYIIDPTNYLYLSRFIFTIYQSILNVKKYLPDWIYRLYIDPSVLKAINYVNIKANNPETINKDKYKKLYELYFDTLKNIYSSPNCEIYFTMCSDYVNQDPNSYGKRRKSRFSGFFESDVNINASREADGLIEYIDCYNLLVFEKLPIVTFCYYEQDSNIGMSYGTQNYGYEIPDMLFTFSAGVIASKIQINDNFYYQSQDNVVYYYKKTNNTDYKGYDEHFLFELFRQFIIINKTDEKENEKIIDLFGILKQIESNIGTYISYENIDTITNNGISKIIDETNDHFAKVKNYSLPIVKKNLAKLSLINTQEFMNYINYRKKTNKFIIIEAMWDTINITQGAGFLISEKHDFDNTLKENYNEEYDYSYLELFNKINKDLRNLDFPIKEQLLGGNYDKYYKKYLKYKNKYMKLKNNNK